jgi:diguanylate cyclase (GGDEF)-like protein/PAS domain S-box-containing protein
MDFNFEEIYKLIFERSNYGVAIVDMEGHIVLANPRFCKMLGYNEGEILGMSFRDITYPEDLEENLKLFEEVRIGKRDYYQLEKRYVRKDGSFLWARLNSFLIKDLTGISYVMELVDDITQAKTIKSELERVYQAIEQASDWVIITDRDGNIEYANRVVEDITGYKREELLGKNPRIFKSGKHSREFYRDLWNTILSGDTFYGTITNRKKTGELFELFHTITPLKDNKGNITHFISTAKDITPEKLLMERIECLSYTDSLTGLANRNFFINRITQEILEAKGRKIFLAIVAIDINNFTSVNYIYGYLVGDNILKEVGVRLSESVPEGYTVARLGSDEFGILAVNIKNLDEVNVIIHRILNRFSSPIEFDSMSIPINISIGVSIYPNDGKDAQTLLKNVDIAISESKNNRRNTNNYTFFSRELNEKTERFLEIQRRIINSINRDSLIIHYQPYFDINTKELVGIEALSRCLCAEAGQISTEELFNVLEETGMILTVGDWIIDRVLLS